MEKKTFSSTNGGGKIGYLYVKDLYLTLLTKITLKIKDRLKFKTRNTKILEENIGINLLGMDFSNRFFGYDT